MSDTPNNKKLTTASGRPFAENENSMSIGARGPLLLQDYILHEKMAHFNRERIPESRPGRLLAHVIHPGVEHLRAALGTFAERFFAGEIYRRARLAFLVLVVAEIKLRLELRAHLHDGGERKSLLAAETLQRPDRAFV